MYTVIILPIAKKDIRDNSIQQNEKKKGLGLKFTHAIRSEIKFICKNPLAFVNQDRCKDVIILTI